MKVCCLPLTQGTALPVSSAQSQFSVKERILLSLAVRSSNSCLPD